MSTTNTKPGKTTQMDLFIIFLEFNKMFCLFWDWSSFPLKYGNLVRLRFSQLTSGQMDTGVFIWSDACFGSVKRLVVSKQNEFSDDFPMVKLENMQICFAE